MSRVRILTWHVHGSYLYYLSHADCEFLLPYDEQRSEGYGGLGGSGRWGPNVREIPVERVADEEFDLVLYQSHRNYLVDRQRVLTDAQRRLPCIFLEHDPPRGHPTDTRHPVDDPGTLLVHVTHFNDLMWDAGRTPTRVIEHGVTIDPEVGYGGDLARGLVIVNGLAKRGRRLGADVFERVRERVPLDLVGMESERLGGLGEVPLHELPAFASRYRFVFNPIRYTSLGLAVCESMAAGLPVVGLATTAMVTVIENGVNGFVDTDVERLIAHMERLLEDPAEARRLGDAARRTAQERFSIERFARDWEETFAAVAERTAAVAAGPA